MTNEQLVALIKNHIDEADNMLKLWQQNQGMIAKIARQYSGYEDIEDLKQEGFIGLCNAVQGYDPAAGASFIRYAVFWIKQAMKRYIDNCGNCVRIPVHVREKMQQLKKFEAAYLQYYGTKPTDEEIYLYLGFDQKTIANIRNGCGLDATASLDKEITTSSSEDAYTLMDTVASDEDIESNILDQIEEEELKDVIWPLVDALPEEMPDVIRGLYVNGLNLNQISKKAGLPYSRTRKMRDDALKTLREPSNKRKLLPFFPEAMGSMAYHGCGAGVFDRTWTSSTERAAIWDMDD